MTDDLTVAFENDRTPQPPLRITVFKGVLAALPVHRVMMVLLHDDWVLYAEVPDVPGRRRTEVVMRVRVQWVVRGEVLDRPVHRRRPHVRTILEELCERPTLSSLHLQCIDRGGQVLVDRPE